MWRNIGKQVYITMTYMNIFIHFTLVFSLFTGFTSDESGNEVNNVRITLHDFTDHSVNSINLMTIFVFHYDYD